MKQQNRSSLYRLSVRSMLGLTLFTLPALTLSSVFTLSKSTVLAQQPDPTTEPAMPQSADSEMDLASIEPVIQTDDPMQIQPQNPSPEWAPTIDPQMMAVVEQLTALAPPPYPQLTGAQAREAPTATSAVMEILRKTGTAPVAPAVDVSHQVIPGPTDQGILVRTYTPLQGDGPFPVIVYYHGGGWVIANVDTYEPSARALAAKTGAIVVSVAYRQAPENPFPAAHEDAFAAYEWARENAGDINGDPTRVAVAGESAGGNLAVATALLAKETGIEMPEHILSVYPIADGDVDSPSYDEYANAKPLNRPFMEWFFENYIGDPDDFESPLISLVDADVSGLPPTTIINAEIDPLRSEGEDLAVRMEEAGVPVVQQTFPGVTHEFFGMAAILEQAVDAQALAARRLRESLAIDAPEEMTEETSEEMTEETANRK